MNVRRWLGVGVAVSVCVILATGGVVGLTAEGPDPGSVELSAEMAQIDEPFDPRPGTFTVTEVSPGKRTADVGETLPVRAIIDSNQQEPVAVSVTLTANGEEVETQTTGKVPQSKFPITALFEWTPQEPGVYQIAVNDVEARNEVVVGDVVQNTSDDANDDDDTGEANNTVDPDQFSVVNVSLDQAEIGPGEATTVFADIRNDGDEAGDYEVTLEVDGEGVQTETVPAIQPLIEVGAQQRFEVAPNETGTYTISVNGVEADRQLVVKESGGGGGLFGFLGFLGFLPLGLLRTVLLFVGLPVLLIYLVLKGAAIYLGY
jgi:hypothetical protein